jgi:hypothetical protein
VKTVNRRRQPWTLANTTRTAWLRPYLPGTVTLTSGAVELITGENGNNFGQGTAGNRPTIGAALNGKAGLNFNGSQWLTSTGAASVYNFLHQTGGIIVAVWRAGNVTNPNAAYALLGNSAVSAGNHGFAFFFDDRSTVPRNERVIAQVVRGVPGAPTVQNISGESAHSPNTPIILTHIFAPAAPLAADRSIIRVNGVQIQNNADTNAASGANASFALQVGAAGNNLFPLVGLIHEIGILPLSGLETVQRAEGYLAGPVAGFNLQSLLPAGHPFKSAPPMV